MKGSVASGLAMAIMLGASGGLAADLPVRSAPRPFVMAKPSTGFYVIGGGGILLPGSDRFDDRNCANFSSLLPCGVENPIKADNGWSVAGAVGYRFAPWLRADVGIGYGEVDASGGRPVSPGGLFAPSYRASFQTTSGIATGYIDLAGLLAPGALGYFEPFIGAGAGVAHARVRDVSFTNSGFIGTQFFVPGGEENRFIWRLTAGTGVRLGAIGLPQWRVDVAYSYYDLGRVQTDPGLVLPTNGTPPFPTNGFEFQARSHAVEFGLRYDF